MGWFDDPEPKHKRKTVTKAERLAVWTKYIGASKAEGKCYVCKRTIHIMDFEVGHNKARALGGRDHIDNYRPICRTCNASMKTQSIETFKAKFTKTKPTTSKTPRRDEDSLAALEVKVRKHLSENGYRELSNRHGFDLCAIKEGGLLSADKYVAIKYNQSSTVSASEFRTFLAKTSRFSNRVGGNVIISPEVYGLMAYTGELPKDVAALARDTRITLKKF